MDSDYVFAKANCGTCTNEGISVNLREGDVWSASDPIVQEKPGLFSKTPPGPNFPRRTVPAVEQDAPTEHRRGRRG